MSTTYTKVEKWTPDKPGLEKYAGDYWSEELETMYHVVADNEKLTISHRWLGEFGARPITQDVFRTDIGMFIKFVRDEKAEISGLSFDSSRTSNVFFKRMQR